VHKKIAAVTKKVISSSGKTPTSTEKTPSTSGKIMYPSQKIKSLSSEKKLQEYNLDESDEELPKVFKKLASFPAAQTSSTLSSKKLAPQQRLLPRDDIIYIRTPSGAIVGIPSKKNKSDDGSTVHRATSPGGSPPPGEGSRPGVAPRIDQYNVWSVLEKLLAATQSMGMLLGSLKEDLKRTGGASKAGGATVVNAGAAVTEKSKKKREVATKLWRAFVAYKKSFQDIETFSRVSCKTTDETPTGGSITNGTSQGTSPRATHTGLPRMGLSPTTGELINLDEVTNKTSSSVVKSRKRAVVGQDEAYAHIEKRPRVESSAAVTPIYQTVLVASSNGAVIQQIVGHDLSQFSGSVLGSAGDNSTVQYVHYIPQSGTEYGDQTAVLVGQVPQEMDRGNVEGLQYEPMLGMEMQN